MKASIAITHRTGQYFWPWLAVASLGVACALGIVHLSQQSGGAEATQAIALGIGLVAPLFVRWIRGGVSTLEPIVFVTAVLFYYFVFSPLISILTEDYVFLGRSFLSLYSRGFLAVAIAASAIWLGYSLPPGASLGRSISHWIQLRRPPLIPRVRGLAWKLTLAAVVALLAWARLSGRSIATLFLPGLLTQDSTRLSGESYNYLYLAIEWFIPAFVLLTYTGGLKNRTIRWLYFGVVFLVYFSIGFRYRILILIGAIAVIQAIRLGKKPRAVPVIATALIFVLVASYLGQARLFFRSAGREGTVAVGTSDELFDSARGDTRIFEGFLAVTDAVPRRIPHAGLEPIKYVFVLPIPRQVWRNKPPPHYLSAIPASFATRGSRDAGTAIPYFGEHYLAFGWWGLVIGSVLLGVLLQALWTFYRAGPEDLFVRVIFAISLPFLFQVITRGYLPQIVQEWVFLVGPVLAIRGWVAYSDVNPPAQSPVHAVTPR